MKLDYSYSLPNKWEGLFIVLLRVVGVSGDDIRGSSEAADERDGANPSRRHSHFRPEDPALPHPGAGRFRGRGLSGPGGGAPSVHGVCRDCHQY